MEVLLAIFFGAIALFFNGIMCFGPVLLFVGVPMYFWFRSTVGRIKEMATLAQRLNLQFWPSDTEIPRKCAFLDRIGEGSDVTSMNLLEGEYGGYFVRVFDCIRHPRTQEGRKSFSVFVLEMNRNFPELHIFPQSRGAILDQMRGGAPVAQTGHEGTIDVYCQEPEFARAVCHPGMLDTLRQHRDLPIEIERDCVALVFDQPLKSAIIEQRLTQLVEIANQIPEQLPNADWMQAPDWQPQDPERWQEFEELAARLGVQHRSWDPVSDNKYLHINDVHQYARTRGAFNVLDAQHDGRPARVFDYHHPTSTEAVKDFVFCVFDVDRELPTLQVYPASTQFRESPDGMVEVPMGGPSRDIGLDSVEFSKAFVVRSSSKRFAYDFCHPRMMEFLMQHQDVRIEVKKNFVAFGFLKTLTPREIEARFEQLLSIRTLFPEYLLDGGTGTVAFDDTTKQGCVRSGRMQVNPKGCAIASAVMLAFILVPLTCIGLVEHDVQKRDKRPRRTPEKEIQLPAEKPDPRFRPVPPKQKQPPAQPSPRLQELVVNPDNFKRFGVLYTRSRAFLEKGGVRRQWKKREGGQPFYKVNKDQVLMLRVHEAVDLNRLASTNLRHVDCLDFGNVAIFDAGAVAACLKTIEAVPTLREMHLPRGRPIHPDFLNALPGLGSLCALNLTDAELQADDFAFLAQCGLLEYLDLTRAKIRDEDLAHVSRLRKLQVLVLSHTDTTDEGLAHLAGLENLQCLELAQTNISGPGLAYLQGMGRLLALIMSGAPIDDAGLAYFPQFPVLHRLNLCATNVEGPGLAQIRGLSLYGLYLSGSPVTDAAVPHLSAMKTVESLALQNTLVSETGFRTLEEALPRCSIGR